MQLTLIRHSKTLRDSETPITQWILSDEGVDLAKDMSSNPFIKSLDIICPSFQTKAIETALILAKSNKLKIYPHAGLTEITSFTNQFDPNKESYEKQLHDFYHGNVDRLNNGETYMEALERFNKAIEEIIESNPNAENIGIVAHGNILAFFSTQFSNVDTLDLHLKIKMPDVAILDWDNKKFIKFWGEII
jgi:broad specificity phosphatase PhoE